MLDPDAQIADVDLSSGMEELKRRLEVLLGTKPDAPPDESLRKQVEKETEILARKERVANAGGQLIGAAFAFIDEMFAGTDASDQTVQLAETFKARLSEGLEKGEDGKLTMKLSFPDEGTLDNLAKSLARMVSLGN
ncbi:MAG: hypothetical protein SRB2_04419 [Desulfobacteraceae bacterium Eth-SRB2]|nr:MAG: hypothetical protein SRB2_04419 [Desulfobacteraceae bacterium Eth-SRB2]